MSLFDYASEKLINELEKSKSPMLSVSMGMEPVMPMAQGGGLSTVQNSLSINGEPHRLAYINPSEESLLQQLGGSGRKIDGIPSYYSRSWTVAIFGLDVCLKSCPMPPVLRHVMVLEMVMILFCCFA